MLAVIGTGWVVVQILHWMLAESLKSEVFLLFWLSLHACLSSLTR